MISVIIPSNLDERLQWLKHALMFLFANGFEGEVLVGVWGGHTHISGLKASFPKVRFFEHDAAHNFTARSLELAHVSTGDYLIQIGDDDFLVPETLVKLAEMLQKHPYVFAVQGRTLQITHDPYNLITFPMWPANESTALTRFSKYCTQTGQIFHAMLRRADFIERLEYMDRAMAYTKNHIWFEIIGDFYCVIKNRFIITDDVFILRSKHPGNTSRGLIKNDFENMFPHYVLSPQFSDHYQFFQKELFSIFQSKGVNASASEIRREIQVGFLNLLWTLIYGRRVTVSPGEKAFEEKCAAKHPDIAQLVEMVADAKPRVG